MNYFTTMKDGKINPVFANDFSDKYVIPIINNINSKEDFLKFVNEDWFYDTHYIFDEDTNEWFVITNKPHFTPDGKIDESKIRTHNRRPRMETVADHMEHYYNWGSLSKAQIKKMKRENPNIKWDHQVEEIKMKTDLTITIDEENDEVAINGERCSYDESFKGETIEKALVSLVNKLGYKPKEIIDLFEKQIE